MIRADKLLLFDIDGTLVDTEGAGLVALEAGFFNAFPFCREKAFPSLDLGGATDSSVVAFLFDHFAIENHGGHRDLFFDEYLLALDCCMREFRDRGKGRVLSGVPELLGRLEKCEDYLLGILTGNVEAGARLKLKHFDIDHYFGFGAFGNHQDPMFVYKEPTDDVSPIMNIEAPPRTYVTGDRMSTFMLYLSEVPRYGY